ncbi:MAG: Ig-like domain-containing protein [Campylobacterales bacterium]|nr:Ig-like domain-containing protein [Campylobacterales bacterium]
MKKLLICILLLTYGTLSFSQDIDINQSRGTDQTEIASLTPIPAQTDVSKDVVIKAKFTVALDPKSIQKNEITLKRITQTKKNAIDGSITYNAEEKSLAFIPRQSLREGYYEISIKSLRTLGEERDTHIGGIKYRFFVTAQEVVNGYKLPPEPDPDLNNATLLGIDSNDNGIRDDVERFIVIKYKDHHKIVTEIGFQKAKAYQKILENPLNTEENHKALHDAMDCNFYFETVASCFGDPILIDQAIELRPIQLNIKSRVKAYLEYDKQLSGGVYEMTKADKMKQKCAFDVDGLLGGE